MISACVIWSCACRFVWLLCCFNVLLFYLFLFLFLGVCFVSVVVVVYLYVVCFNLGCGGWLLFGVCFAL